MIKNERNAWPPSTPYISSHCGLHCTCIGPHMGGKKGWVNLEESQHHVKDSSLLIHLQQTEVLIVLSLQRATREKGQRLRLTSPPPLVRANMLQTHNSVTLDRLPTEGGNAELLNFKAATLFCIADGYWMTRVIGQEHIYIPLAANRLIFPEWQYKWLRGTAKRKKRRVQETAEKHTNRKYFCPHNFVW